MDSKKPLDEAPVTDAPVDAPAPAPAEPAIDPVALLEEMAETIAKIKGDEQGKTKIIADLQAQVADLQKQLADAKAAQPAPSGGKSQADIDNAVSQEKAAGDQRLADAVKRVKDGAKAIITDLELKDQQADEAAKDQVDGL